MNDEVFEKAKEEDIDLSFTKAGRFLIYSLWIQSQLSDLIILDRNKGIINDFNTNPIMPEILQRERFIFWEKDFKEVKEIFEKEFSNQLTKQAKLDLNAIYYLRNAISHSQVSVGRKYLLYKPNNKKTLDLIREVINITNKDDPDPNLVRDIIKIDFSENEQILMNLIKRFDETFLKEICKNIGVVHPRIR